MKFRINILCDVDDACEPKEEDKAIMLCFDVEHPSEKEFIVGLINGGQDTVEKECLVTFCSKGIGINTGVKRR